MAIVVASCSSTNSAYHNGKSDELTRARLLALFPDNPNLRALGEKIEDFYYADSSTTILPYVSIIRQFDNMSAQQFCHPTSKSKLEQALALNPTSLLVNSQLFKCAGIDKNLQQAKQYFERSQNIAMVLLSQGSGETVETAIEIREIDESYVLLELNGLAALDVEILRDGDDFVYQFHVIDIQQRKFVYRYFKNTRLLGVMLSSLAGTELSMKQVVNISMNTYLEEQHAAVLVLEARAKLDLGQYREAIKLLTPVQNKSGLAATLLAEAYIKSDQADKLPEVLELVDISAQNGLIEAKLLLAQYLHIFATTDNKLADSDLLLRQIDELTTPGHGVDLLTKKLGSYPDSVALLAKWFERAGDQQKLLRQ